LKRWPDFFDEITEKNAHRHGEKDPECEETIEIS
jgi:hypothetical protein